MWALTRAAVIQAARQNWHRMQPTLHLAAQGRGFLALGFLLGLEIDRTLDHVLVHGLDLLGG